MKLKIFTFLLLMLGFASGIALAQDSSGSGWTYDAGTKTLTVTGILEGNDYKKLDIKKIIIDSNVTELKREAFSNMTTIESVVFNENSQLTKISVENFYNCVNLKSIDIPNSVTEIGEGSFARTGLTDVYIPSNVMKIGDGAFNSNNLSSVTFGEDSKLAVIGSYAFSKYLNSIVVPASVDTVGIWFMGNRAERVEFLGKTPPIVKYMDGDDIARLPIENEDCMIIVPDSAALNSFKAADKWNQYTTYLISGTEPPVGSFLLTYEGSLNINTDSLPKYVQIGDTFTIYPVEGYNKLSIIYSTSAFEHIYDESSPYLPSKVRVEGPGHYGKVNLSVEAYEFIEVEDGYTYCFDPSTKSVVVRSTYFNESTVSILSEVEYTDGKNYPVKRIMHFNPEGNVAKHLIVPETIERMDVGAFKYPVDEYVWETIEFLGSVPPEVENNDAGLTSATTIIVPSEEAVNKFRENPSFNMCEIVVHGTIVIPTETKVEYKYANDTIKGSIGISFDGKLPASYEKIPENVDSIKVVANPLLGFKLSGDISIIEGGNITKVSNGAYYELKGTGSIVIAATFEKDESVNVDYELEKAPEVDNNEPEVGVNTPTVVASNSDFTVTEGQSVKVISEAVTKETEVNSYINAINEDKGTSISVTNTVIYDITPVIVSSLNPVVVVGKAEVSVGSDVTLALPYPNNLSASDLESVTVYHFADNGDIEKLTTNKKDNYIEVSGVTSFSPFVLTYTVAEPPVVITYHDLHITESVGAKLVSRNDKDRTPDGGSFTLSLEKEEGYEDCEPIVYYKRGRFGEWKELKLDEVSGYYQIRSVYTDIYVKVSGDGIWPVSNEEVEAQEVKVYTQNGAIIVSTPSLMDVQIISMTGAQVAADKVAGQREFRNLAEGIYVVRVGDKIVKVRL